MTSESSATYTSGGPCRWCGKPCRRAKRVYCSRQCYGHWQNARPNEERFWPHVQKTEGCWLWTSTVNDDGYGHFRDQQTKRELYVHRYSYTIHHGPIPKGRHVLHSCDNPPCCNPAHLSLGDHDTNMADKARKGRGVIRLTEAKVREIREKRKRGVRSVALQAEYGVSQSAIYEVINGRSWRWVI